MATSPYVPNVANLTEPLASRSVESAALEFRTLKAFYSSVDQRIDNIEEAVASLDGNGGLPGLVYIQRLSGTGVQTVYTLALATTSSFNVDVYVQGLYQQHNTFTVSGTTLTFSEAPPAGADNIEVQISVAQVLGGGSGGSIDVTVSYFWTANQNFNGANIGTYSGVPAVTSTGLTVGLANSTNAVILDGAKLQSTLDNTVDLGAAAFSWKNLYIKGSAFWNGYSISAPSGDVNAYLRNDGVWAVPPGSGGASSLYVPVIIFVGESNSGGYALNTDLTAGQRAVRSAVKILNNTSLLFESLDIDTNNLIGHTGLTANATHGWENGLATSVEAGEWGFNPVYLIKAGQGGSVISEWGTTGAYFTTLVTRVNAAYAAIRALGKQPLPFIWYSQGINDAIANTAAATWKAATKVHLTNLRNVIGFAPVITPEFMAGRESYTAALNELANEYPFIFVVSSLSAGLRDVNHWNAAGMALLASRMSATSISKVGTSTTPYTLAAILGVSRYAGATSSTPYTLPDGAITFTGLTNAAINTASGEIQSTGAVPSGGRDTFAVNATAAFKYEWDVQATGGYTDTVVVLLDDTATNNFNWSTGSGEAFLSGIYANSDGNMYVAVTAGATVTSFARPTAGVFRMKAEKSGNNLVYSWSSDGGTTWTVLYTHTNRLLSISTAYIKVLFATADSTKRVTLRKLPF